MTAYRYLLDENVDPALRAALLRRDPELVVWLVGDPGCPRRGTPDGDILRWCEEHDFVLVTHDRRTMPNHLDDHLRAGHRMPGIIMVSPRLALAETIDDLLLIANAATRGELDGMIVYLPVR